MKISKDSFFSVGKSLNISPEQMEALWKGLESTNESAAAPFAKYLYYFGGLIVIFTMTWFFDLGKELFGGGGIFLIATAYALVCTLLGRYLWNKGNLKMPGGLLLTIAVSMVPLAIYGLQTYFNLWSEDNTPEQYKDFYSTIDGNWVFMELGTIIAGLIMLWHFPFPFLTAPIFTAAWFLTMDIVSLIFGRDTLTWDQRSAIAMGFGLILLIISFLIDRRKTGDYAFWGYLFGALSFWGGLGGLVWEKNEGILFIYLLINLVLMALSIILRRTVLMVFGAIGAFAYLGHLAHKFFADSLAFPLALSVIGLGIIYLGIIYQRNAKKIEATVFKMLPASLTKYFR